MSKILVKIKKSNIDNFKPENEHELYLEKCLGLGSYGYIFKFDNFAIKILQDKEESFDENYCDLNEIQTVEKFIELNPNFQVICNKYCTGNILYQEEQKLVDGKINIFVNNYSNQDEINSVVIKKRKRNIFQIFHNYPIIIMPIFIPYDKNTFENSFIRKDIYILKLLDYLVNATNEMLSIGLVNLDLKSNNSVIDNNGDLKIIDFGMVKKIDKMNNIFTNEIKYYIWPFGKSTISQCLSYMVAAFIIEIYYPKFYNIKTNSRLKKFILDNFGDILTLPFDIKDLIINTLIYGMDWEDFVSEYSKIKQYYDLSKIKIPFRKNKIISAIF